MKRSHLIAGLLIVVALVGGCRKEEDYAEPEAFSFVVYPGARYLGQLTEVTRQAHKLVNPDTEPPPVAIYESEAQVDEVATFYAKAYGYGSVASDSTNNFAASKPPAYYRSGDMATDIKGIEALLPRLNLKTDTTRSVGSYRAAEISPRPNRPRVTVQRPYFDVTTSEVRDKTLIMMSR